jgi:hypothetical protein
MITQSEMDDDRTYKDRVFQVRCGLRKKFIENLGPYLDQFSDLGTDEADDGVSVTYPFEYQYLHGWFTGSQIKEMYNIHTYSPNGYGTNMMLDALPVFSMENLSPREIREITIDCFSKYKEVKFHTSLTNYKQDDEQHNLNIFVLDKISDEDMLYHKLMGNVGYNPRRHYYNGFTYFPVLIDRRK